MRGVQLQSQEQTSIAICCRQRVSISNWYSNLSTYYLQYQRNQCTLICNRPNVITIKMQRYIQHSYQRASSPSQVVSKLSTVKSKKIHTWWYRLHQCSSPKKPIKQGKVKKLTYTRRGPYKIIKTHPSGSYDLQLASSKSTVIIKKHGSELILCPKHLVPHKPIESSDSIYCELNKSIIPNPFSQASITGYKSAQPSTSSIQPPETSEESSHLPFPTVAELDNLYDSWPESGNPFTPTIISDNTAPSHKQPAPLVTLLDSPGGAMTTPPITTRQPWIIRLTWVPGI